MQIIKTACGFSKHPYFEIKNVVVTLGLCVVLASGPKYALANDSTTDSLESFGDIMQFALPLAGLGATYLTDDPEGRKQFYKSILTALGTTTALKGVYGKLRPSSTSKTSYPSGHTTSAFAGAAFIDQRYGHGWGSVAYVAAAITGYSRVRADKHFFDDVVAGASIGVMSNLLWVTPHDGNVVIAPAIIGDGIGVVLSVKESVPNQKKSFSPNTLKPKFRYELALGGASVQENFITAPGSTGTTFNLDLFEKIDDPTTTANALFEWFIDDRSELRFTLFPFESRDNGSFSQPVVFDSATFPANTPIRSAWRHYDLRATYIYGLLPKSNWHLGIGASLSYQLTEIDLKTTDNSVSAKLDNSVYLPLLHTSVGYRFTPRIALYAEFNGISLSDDSMRDGNLVLRYKLNRYWDVGIGGGYYERSIKTSELNNDVEYNTGYITVGYTFY